MKINELKIVSAKDLNESLAKTFGTKLRLEDFTNEQLEDARNKLRTQLSQVETNESFDTVHKSDAYQKGRMFLDVINQEIAERTKIAEKAKPDFLDIDKDGDKKEPMKKALKDKKKKPVGEDQVDEFDGVDSPADSDQNLMRAVHKKFGTKSGRNLGRFSGGRYGKPAGKLSGALAPADMDVALDDPAVKMMIDAGILTLNPSAMKKYAAMQSEGSDTPNLDKINKGIDDYYTGFDALGGKSPTGELMKLIAKGIYNALDAAGVQVEPEKIKKAAANAATTLESKQSKSKETQIVENYFAHAKKLFEGEEDKAEIVMAAKDMVDRVTGWMEDTAEMQAESMLELGDAIRDEMGEAQSETFIQTVKPALESLYTALESTRGALTGGVGQLTGEAEPAVDMGTPDEMPAEDPAMEPTVDAEAGDDFGAAEPAAGGEDEAGRAKRESIDLSRRLGTILSSKKK